MERYDLIIIGAGPAGVTSAIYAQRAGLNFLLLEKAMVGGKVVSSYEIENYPGFSKIEGPELAMNYNSQIKYLGVNFKREDVNKIKKGNDLFIVTTNKNEYEAKFVVIATGTKENKLNLENEDKFLGKGVSFCATCDGAFYKDKKVTVYGGGDSAITEAIFLAKIVKTLYIVSRHSFRGEKKNIDKLAEFNNVVYYPDTVVTGLSGDTHLESINILHEGIKEDKIECDGIFVYIGSKPELSFLDFEINKDNKGYIIVNEFETSSKNLFAIGDVTSKNLRQIITAESDGAQVIRIIEERMK